MRANLTTPLNYDAITQSDDYLCRSATSRFSFCFAAASDEGLFEADVLQARRDKEASSLAQWRAHIAQATAAAPPGGRFKDLHSWLHQTHLCYAVSRQGEFDKVAISDPRLLASY